MNEQERQQWREMMLRRATRLERWFVFLCWLFVAAILGVTIAWLVGWLT